MNYLNLKCLRIGDWAQVDWGSQIQTGSRVENLRVIGLIKKEGKITLTVATSSEFFFPDEIAEALGIPKKYRKLHCWRFTEGDCRISRISTFPYRSSPNPSLVK